MSYTVQNAVEAIQDIVLTVYGIKKAPDIPPDKIQPVDFPIAITYPYTGSFGDGPSGWKKALHDIRIEVHVPLSTSIEKAWTELVPFIDSVPQALMEEPTLNDIVSTFGDITYQTSPLNYAGISTLGIVFTISGVKMQA